MEARIRGRSVTPTRHMVQESYLENVRRKEVAELKARMRGRSVTPTNHMIQENYLENVRRKEATEARMRGRSLSPTRQMGDFWSGQQRHVGNNIGCLTRKRFLFAFLFRPIIPPGPFGPPSPWKRKTRKRGGGPQSGTKRLWRRRIGMARRGEILLSEQSSSGGRRKTLSSKVSTK